MTNLLLENRAKIGQDFFFGSDREDRDSRDSRDRVAKKPSAVPRPSRDSLGDLGEVHLEVIGQDLEGDSRPLHRVDAVSYTHLTLPTN